MTNYKDAWKQTGNVVKEAAAAAAATAAARFYNTVTIK
jgi:hypothetical protein